MNFKRYLLIAACAFLAISCTAQNGSEESSNSSDTQSSNTDQSSSGSSSSSTDQSSSSSSSSSSDQGGSESSGPTKVIVPAHTLSDSNPPINVNSKGQAVSKSTWESFRNAPDSKFSNNYNYTYQSMSGGMMQREQFTKNGYCIISTTGSLYYERKSGSTFYTYIASTKGYLRSETVFDLQSKYIYRIKEEIKVHMFDFENYEFDEDLGMYFYQTTAFGNSIKFQNGYLTYLSYGMTGASFVIDASFETTIDIPQSYYYQ